jgi:hypothetical protein
MKQAAMALVAWCYINIEMHAQQAFDRKSNANSSLVTFVIVTKHLLQK